MLQVHAPARQQAQPPTQSAVRKLKKAPKQINGPDKQLVERKRKADATVDDLAASSLQGMSGCTVLTPTMLATTLAAQYLKPCLHSIDSSLRVSRLSAAPCLALRCDHCQGGALLQGSTSKPLPRKVGLLRLKRGTNLMTW